MFVEDRLPQNSELRMMTSHRRLTHVHIDGQHRSVSSVLSEAMRQMQLAVNSRLTVDQKAHLLRASGLEMFSLSPGITEVRTAQQLIAAGFRVRVSSLRLLENAGPQLLRRLEW
jgi:hypothetical protein